MTTTCRTGKLRYRDRLAAAFALAVTRNRRNGRREECRSYRCPDCHGYHLTSVKRGTT